MNLTARIALLAVIGALALAGMAALGGPGGRSIAPGPSSAPQGSAQALASSTPSPTGSAEASSGPGLSTGAPTLSMDEYRLARDAICARGMTAKAPLSDSFGLAIDPAASDARRAEGMKALESFVTVADGVADELEALTPPSVVAAEHFANVQQYRDVTTIIRYELTLLRAGKISEGTAVDLLTDEINKGVVAFEARNFLVECP